MKAITVININPECEHCGLCCNSYTFWMSNRSYENDPKEIKKLIEYHNCEPMKNAKGELGIKIPIACVHLRMNDKKSECLIHDKKPVVCKEYYCERTIKKALERQLEDGVHI